MRDGDLRNRLVARVRSIRAARSLARAESIGGFPRRAKVTASERERELARERRRESPARTLTREGRSAEVTGNPAGSSLASHLHFA